MKENKVKHIKYEDVQTRIRQYSPKHAVEILKTSRSVITSFESTCRPSVSSRLIRWQFDHVWSLCRAY